MKIYTTPVVNALLNIKSRPPEVTTPPIGYAELTVHRIVPNELPQISIDKFNFTHGCAETERGRLFIGLAVKLMAAERPMYSDVHLRVSIHEPHIDDEDHLYIAAIDLNTNVQNHLIIPLASFTTNVVDNAELNEFIEDNDLESFDTAMQLRLKRLGVPYKVGAKHPMGSICPKIDIELY